MMRITAKLRLALLAAASSAGWSTLCGEDLAVQTSWYEHEPERAWLEPYDPTLLSRRLLTEFEYEDREDGNANAKWKWNLRWTFPMTKDLVAGLQLEAPLRWADEGAQNDTGFGDLETRAGVVGRISAKTRWAVAMNAKLPTATSELLGDGLIELRPIAALRWEPADWLEVGAGVEYNFTPRDEGDDRVSALELKLPFVAKLAERLSGFASYNPRWNDVKGSWRQRLELGLTWFLGTHKEYALSLGGEFPLIDEAFEWKTSMGLTRYFK